MTLLSKYRNWLIPSALASAVFLLVFIFFSPVVNSDDDVFLMYQLAGGHGDAPTNLLHYNQAFHPWLGFILAGLFSKFPLVNWYSWFFIFCQFVSWVIIGRVLLQQFSRIIAVQLLLLLFILTGVSDLQSLNMTSTTWLLSLASMAYLLVFPRRWVGCFLLLLIAASIRMQIPVIVMLLFLPLQWSMGKQAWWSPILFLLLTLTSFWGLNFSQKQFYKNHIPGWHSTEQFRQDLFYSYNRPRDIEKPDSVIFNSPVEKAFFDRTFFYDSSFPSGERISGITRSVIRYRDLSTADDSGALHWTWRAWRLYLLYLLIALFLAWQGKHLKRWIRNCWLPFAVIAVFYVCLFVFFKFTEAFFMGILLMIALQLILTWPGKKEASQGIAIAGFLFLLPLCWSISRELANDRQTRAGEQQFICGWKEIAGHPDKLFISMGESLPVKYFPVFLAPSLYPLENFIYKERVITRSYAGSMKRHGVEGSLIEHLEGPQLLYAGAYFPELIQKANGSGKALRFSERDSSFHCLEIRKILVQ